MILTTKGIRLDQLTKDFFSNDFPKFNKSVTMSDDVLETDIPVLELPLRLNVTYLLELLKDQTTEIHVRPKYPYETEPRIANWNIQPLWSDGTIITNYSDFYYKKCQPPCEKVEPTPTSAIIKNYLEQFGFTLGLCFYSVFDAGGYVRPHRDIRPSQKSLDYIWIPLNNPNGSELKVYPYGTVKINLGSAYLLNQSNYVHAVKNQSNEQRKVLLGYIRKTNKNFLNLVESCIREKYRLTDEN